MDESIALHHPLFSFPFLLYNREPAVISSCTPCGTYNQWQGMLLTREENIKQVFAFNVVGRESVVWNSQKDSFYISGM